MVTVTLTHPSINSGTAVRVLCDNVTVSGKKNNKYDPNANLTGDIVEVQTQSIENPMYRVQGIHFTGASGTLTYPMFLTLYRHKYGGAAETGALAPVTLNVTYGSGTALVGVDGSTTNIKVIMEDFNFPIDVKDSAGGYLPIGNANFRETS